MTTPRRSQNAPTPKAEAKGPSETIDEENEKARETNEAGTIGEPTGKRDDDRDGVAETDERIPPPVPPDNNPQNKPDLPKRDVSVDRPLGATQLGGPAPHAGPGNWARNFQGQTGGQAPVWVDPNDPPPKKPKAPAESFDDAAVMVAAATKKFCEAGMSATEAGKLALELFRSMFCRHPFEGGHIINRPY